MSSYTYQKNQYKQSAKSKESEFLSILLIYVLPFVGINLMILFLAIVKPKYEVVVGETNDYMSTSLTLSIDSILPTKNLSVTLNSKPLEMEKTGKKTYTASIKQNGVINIYLESFNGMAVSTYENINVLDDEPPSAYSPSIEKDMLTINVSDSQSGVDFGGIRAVDASGKEAAPISIDKQNSKVSFLMEDEALTVFIKDKAGNQGEYPFTMTDSN